MAGGSGSGGCGGRSGSVRQVVVRIRTPFLVVWRIQYARDAVIDTSMGEMGER